MHAAALPNSFLIWWSGLSAELYSVIQEQIGGEQKCTLASRAGCGHGSALIPDIHAGLGSHDHIFDSRPNQTLDFRPSFEELGR